MKKRIVLQLLTVMLVSVTSCSPVLYSTVGQNVPLFKEKGEVSMSASYASANNGDGLSLQASGAVGNHVAVIGSFYTLSEEHNDNDGWRGKGSYGEIGAGAFGTLNPAGNLVYEAFAGVGSGSIKNARYENTVDVKFFKPFIQPSIGYTSKWFEAAFTPRLGVVSYTSHTFVWSGAEPNEAEFLEANFEREKTTFVFEPGLTFRTGYKGIKLQIQYNYTTFSPWEDDEGDMPAVNADFFSIGVHYMISKRYLEK
jgi:hypothetical protein